MTPTMLGSEGLFGRGDASNLLGAGVLFLGGPTASGKSAVAVALAKMIGGEVVNADAFQLNQGLDVCTAKPTQEEQANVPHHLLGTLEIHQTCDAGQFREMALPVLEEIRSRGRWPIVVGGSGLYLKSLTHGLAPLPRADDELRASLAAMTKEQRIDKLLRLDPQAPSNVPLANDRYVSRALEICILSGRPQSELRQSWLNNEPEFMGVIIQRDRDELYRRIDARVLEMLERGLVDEIRQAPAASLTACKAIGISQISDFIRGACTLPEAIAAMQQATRRYAKRQLTWFKRERGFQTVCLTPESTAQSAAERILELFPCLQSPPPSYVPSSSI